MVLLEEYLSKVAVDKCKTIFTAFYLSSLGYDREIVESRSYGTVNDFVYFGVEHVELCKVSCKIGGPGLS